MRCIVETGNGFEYCKNKTEAIRLAKRYLSAHPKTNSVIVYYDPKTRQSIRSIGKGNEIGAIWFEIGRVNEHHILNFITINV